MHVNGKNFFYSKLPGLKITIDKNKSKWDDKESDYLIRFATYCTSNCCGVSIEHLTPSDKVDPIITSLVRFHTYFTIRRNIRRLKGDESMSVINREFGAGEFYKNLQHVQRNMFFSYKKEVIYYLYPNSFQSDYERYVAVKSDRFTQIGLECLNQSIESYLYFILGSQARTRQSVVSGRPSGLETQEKFRKLFQD